MVKVFNPIFTIKPIVKQKRDSKLKNSIISRKCLAVVKIIDNEFKAVINIDKDTIKLDKTDTVSNEQLILPFTEKSLDLTGKIHVWLKYKDKYGHRICIIREQNSAILHPGFPDKYDALKENLLIAGHIIRKNGKMYFNYENLVKYHYLSKYYVNDVDINDDIPLFNK